MDHFYFVRHGQTVWNVENKICGATDIELTPLGHEQAIETGKKILEMGIEADIILTSPLVRASETARHISEMTGIPSATRREAISAPSRLPRTSTALSPHRAPCSLACRTESSRSLPSCQRA